MDEKELEALKTSNPKQYEFIMNLKKDADEGKTLKTQAEKDKQEKADKEKADKDKNQPNELQEKVRKEKEDAEKAKAGTRQIEGALKFNLSVDEFVKTNADLLPGEIPEILKVAAKENYDTALDRAAAVKVAMIQSFFSVQDNLTALTSGQKQALDEFLKLTKNGKEQKAEGIYENLFEPALETMRKVKKAEELGKTRSGFASGTKTQDDYKNRLMKNSRKAHLGEKGA